MYGQLGAFLFAFISTVTVITTTFWSQWVMTSPESSGMLGPAWGWKGIWADCMQFYGGQYHCEEQASLFLESGHTNAIRGMMVLAMALSVIGCFSMLIGMECSKLLDEALDTKRKIIRICGAMFLGTGALTLASVAWYASMVHRDFFSLTNQDNLVRYEYGATLYVGFVSAFLSFIAGILCLCMPGPQPEKDRYHASSYPFTRSHNDTPKKEKYMDYV